MWNISFEMSYGQGVKLQYCQIGGHLNFLQSITKKCKKIHSGKSLHTFGNLTTSQCVLTVKTILPSTPQCSISASISTLVKSFFKRWNAPWIAFPFFSANVCEILPRCAPHIVGAASEERHVASQESEPPSLSSLSCSHF